MARSPLHVMVLYDLPEHTTGHDQPSYLLTHEDRPTERDVCRAIQKLGLKLSVFGVFDDISALSNVLIQTQPDVIFNLCETFRGDRLYEGNIAALIELSGIPMTGSRADALHLCKDKGVTKKILQYDGLRVPKFTMVRRNTKVDLTQQTLPAIVKPLNREASEGIAQASVVYDLAACQERVAFLHQHLNADVIIEEFIHGRELYVGILAANNGIIGLPPRELFMRNLKEDQAMVATYKAKWDDQYRERWGVSTNKAGPMPKDVLERLSRDSIQAFQSLGLTGYARMDWRMTAQGEPVFLEANPNPALAQDDDFAKSARSYGLTYPELILTLIESALSEQTQSEKSLAAR